MRDNAWKIYSEADKKAVHEFGKNYIEFLSACKTERECTDFFIKRAKKEGFYDLKECVATGRELKSGDGVYADWMGKTLVLFRIGTGKPELGMNILGAHVDSPRLDLKQNPLYEEAGQALFDTHYYGGVKKYQWVTLPLALHGVVVKKDGTSIPICIGEDPSDPVVGVTDLLIHLSAKQLEKPAATVIEGEALNLLVGSEPSDAEKDPVKATVLAVLKEKYDIEEDDLVSAEIEAVPAGKAREFGLDRSMIMGYGHDDRVCAYASAESFFATPVQEKTSVCLLVDKEEIGSVGATGMHSRFFENMVAELCALIGNGTDLEVRRALANSRMLSSDVSAAADANYMEVNDRNNCAYLGKGIVFNKYTGARGKSGSNDASAEYMALIRRIMDDANVCWQTAEIGKVDQGGGGTIAYIAANYGMEVIDSGVAVLNMHAPWEIISKADLYEGKKCYEAFLRNA